jgi:DNA-binding response OmpR family regulator
MTDILIIEDDQEIAEMVREFLCGDGYSCEIRTSGEAGLDYMREHSVRLVLLDILLPGLDGFSVCTQIHQKYNTPIIIVSACNGTDDKVAGLNLGADDYVEKPFSIDVLRAKVDALFRRQYGSSGRRLVAGALDLNVDARTACYAGNLLELSQMEYDLLCFLVEHRGKVLSKETLLNGVWGRDCFVESGTLTVYIKRLRDKLEAESGNPVHIVTVRGVGYRYEE